MIFPCKARLQLTIDFGGNYWSFKNISSNYKGDMPKEDLVDHKLLLCRIFLKQIGKFMVNV
jgi:hypothetical protein